MENIEYLELERNTYIFFDELQELGKQGWIVCERREIVLKDGSNGYLYVFYRKA